jgi:hypothetical protein
MKVALSGYNSCGRFGAPRESETMKKNQVPPRVQKFPAVKQRRLDQLLDKNAEGTITPREKAALERLVAEAEELMVANGKRLAEFAKREPGSPAGAVPVTIWVHPQETER